ncbi:shikimate kinase [Epilithonimonas lactis]|uniref:Shikimate kinase n=1 Tax=Epilithonimonas lactis TaxID=421072 RepID=A0A085BF20_9FLAO|nr:shikimate kinase [Epilithonimonas lactis]KFC21065.1 shikimate kinase [Epilithonimonas lactis]SEP71747.1 shikimate kinase [Epilithonimonas lactis]
MIISLLGYMGSGKSHISKNLSQKINFKLIDLDQKISEEHQQSIPEIFEKRGEIYFRKEEKRILEELLNSEEDLVLSLGGGTPVYYENMNIINEKSKSFFLRASVGTLTNRVLLQKHSRPLIAKLEDSDIPEFIAKHLFERNPYYSKAHFTIDTDSKNAVEISDHIVELLEI